MRSPALLLAFALALVACGDAGTQPLPSLDVSETSGDAGDASEPDEGAGDASDDSADAAPDDAADATEDTVPPLDVDDASEPADATFDAELPGEDAADAADDTGEPNGWTGNVTCALGERIGGFEVAHWDFYASVAGEVASGVIPLTVLQPVVEEGPCRLLKKENPFCDPPCGGGQLCDHDGTCIAYPANQSVGDVTVTGLDVPAVMKVNVTKSYAKTDVPFPMFEAGAPITLTATGGDLPGFTLAAFGVPTLEIPATILTLKKGADLPVTWTASEGPGTVYMTLNIDQHGNSPATLICEVPDTGSHTIPASLTSALVDAGVSGFATFDLYRRTVDAVELAPGCVELRVFSYASGKVAVEGHVPCVKNTDCPEGQTCSLAINTCVGG